MQLLPPEQRSVTAAAFYKGGALALISAQPQEQQQEGGGAPLLRPRWPSSLALASCSCSQSLTHSLHQPAR